MADGGKLNIILPGTAAARSYKGGNIFVKSP